MYTKTRCCLRFHNDNLFLPWSQSVSGNEILNGEDICFFHLHGLIYYWFKKTHAFWWRPSYGNIFPILCFSSFAVPTFLFQYLHFLEGRICNLLLLPVSSALPGSFCLCLQDVKEQISLCLILAGLILCWKDTWWAVSHCMWYWPEAHQLGFFII